VEFAEESNSPNSCGYLPFGNTCSRQQVLQFRRRGSEPVVRLQGIEIILAGNAAAVLMSSSLLNTNSRNGGTQLRGSSVRSEILRASKGTSPHSRAAEQVTREPRAIANLVWSPAEAGALTHSVESV